MKRCKRLYGECAFHKVVHALLFVFFVCTAEISGSHVGQPVGVALSVAPATAFIKFSARQPLGAYLSSRASSSALHTAVLGIQYSTIDHPMGHPWAIPAPKPM